MKITHFLAGVVSGAVVAVLVLHESVPLQSIPAALSEAVSDLASGFSSNKSDRDGEGPGPIDRPTEIPLRRPVVVMMPYGKVTINAGTRVMAMRQTATGVIAKFGGREVVIPLASFRPPASLAEPTSKGASLSAQRALVHSPASATAPGAPTASVDANPAGQIGIGSFAKSLLVVDGDVSKGSASVISIRGQPLIVTNAHVLSGNKKVKFRRLNSKELPFDKLGISKEYDLAVATQKVLSTGLPMLEDVENNVAVGDDVVVLGNSLGSDVVTEIPGKVTGIGPDLIEVDAKFVHGNSGSPIVHVKTGKVLAVATFVTVRQLSSLDKDSKFDEIRRFGYRLDTAASWEYPGWERFANEAATLKRIRRVTDQLVSVALDIYDDGYLHLEPHQSGDNPVRPCVTEYLQVTKGTTASQADMLAAKQKLFRNLIHVTKRDLAGFDLASFTGWHRNRGKEEAANRDFLLEKFTELANQQDAAAKIRRR